MNTVTVGDLVTISAASGLPTGTVARVEDVDSEILWVAFEGSNKLYPTSASHCLPFQGPIERLASNQFDSPDAFVVRQLANYTSTGARIGSATNIRIIPMLHQLVGVQDMLRIFDTPQTTSRALLVADVGLGKTIEVCLLYSLLRRSNKARNAIFIVPPSLVSHWTDKLRHRFGQRQVDTIRDGSQAREVLQGLAASRHHLHSTRPGRPIVASIDVLKMADDIIQAATGINWDFLVFDEAHHLSWGTQRYELARSLLENNANSSQPDVVFVTATPHSGDSRRYLHLLELVRPGTFRTAAGIIEPVSSGIRKLLCEKAPAVAGNVVRQLREDAVDEKGRALFPDRHVVTVETAGHEWQTREFKEAFAALLTFLKTHRNDLNGAALLETAYKRFASSSIEALVCSLKRRLAKQAATPANSSQSLSESDIPGFVNGEQLENLALSGHNVLVQESQHIKTLLRHAAGCGRSPKVDLLFQLVNGYHEHSGTLPGSRCVIFVEFRSTQQMLQRVLVSHFGSGSVEILNGSMDAHARQASIARFSTQGRFLLATDAASEGIDLQENCSHLINFDLPWNPMRLEQRIGRIHRFGLTETANIYNLTSGISDRVHTVLRNKVKHLAEDLCRSSTRFRNTAAVERELLGIVSGDSMLAGVYLDADRYGSGTLDIHLKKIAYRAAQAWREFALIAGDLPSPLPAQRRQLIQAARLDDVYFFVKAFLHKHHRRLFVENHTDQPKDLSTISFKVPRFLIDRSGPRLVPYLEDKVWARNYTRSYLQLLKHNHLKLLGMGDPIIDAMVVAARAPDAGGHTASLLFRDKEAVGIKGILLFFGLSWTSSERRDVRLVIPVVLDLNTLVPDFSLSAQITGLLRRSPLPGRLAWPIELQIQQVLTAGFDAVRSLSEVKHHFTQYPGTEIILVSAAMLEVEG
jgi:hypothetical protein